MENCTQIKSENFINEETKVSKKGNFFVNYYGFFVIPLFTFILLGIALYANGVWPFGDAIIASYDMLAQVCPILEHFFDVLQGESDIFHTFHLGGGMDMFGILAYCAVSPFTFMFLLAGEGGSIYMVSIVLPFKYAFIGLSAFIFLRRYFKSLPQYLQVVLALLYAFSGYSYVANTYIIWMDLMIWMPLFLAGFIEFVRTKKIRWLIIGIAVNVYTCFSIVCFSLMIVFPIFICYFLICKPKSEWKEYISKLCLAFVVAIALSLPILLPAFMAYMQAGRNTGLFSRVFSVLSESAFKDGDLGLPIYEKFAYIVCDSAFIVLMVIYFFRSQKSDKLSSFMPVVFIYLIFPCLIDESMLLLNMGSYYSYALRFGFLNSMFLLFVSAKCLEDILAGIKDGEVSERNNNVFSLVMMILTVGAVLFTTLFYKYIANGGYEDSKLIKLIFGSNEEMQPFKDFFPLFAP